MIATGHGGLEPHGGVAAGQHVLLDAECGNEEAVNHVLRGHDELDVLSSRNVKFIDLALAFHVLNLPHPLLGYDINFGGVGGRRALLEKYNCAPDKKGDHHKEGKNRPSDFKECRAFDLLRFAAGH